MNRALAMMLVLVAVAGCSASGVTSPRDDAGVVEQVPALRQMFSAVIGSTNRIAFPVR